MNKLKAYTKKSLVILAFLMVIPMQIGFYNLRNNINEFGLPQVELPSTKDLAYKILKDFYDRHFSNRPRLSI